MSEAEHFPPVRRLAVMHAVEGLVLLFDLADGGRLAVALQGEAPQWLQRAIREASCSQIAVLDFEHEVYSTVEE